MARKKITLANKEGRARVRAEANKSVLELVRMRQYYANLVKEASDAGDRALVDRYWQKEFDILTTMLPYQLPKLNSIEVSPDVSGTVELLSEIKRTVLARADRKQLPDGAHDVNKAEDEEKHETDNGATASQTS